LRENAKWRAAAVAGTVAGLALFVALVVRTGPATILESVRAFGGAFAVLIAISGVRHLLRTVAWRLCIAKDSRTMTFGDLFCVRLAAEAVTDLTFAGPVLGESMKALAAAQRMPARDSVSSIVIENLVYSLSVVLFVASGVVAFLLGVALPHRTQLAVAVVAGALVIPVVAIQFAISRRFLVLSTVIDRAHRLGVRVPAIGRRRESIRRFESQVVEFYTGRRALFAAVFALELFACATGVLEAYVILRVTAGHATVFAAYLIESVNRVVNAVFPFLPLRVGVDEGGAALVFRALGYTAAAGVSLAVIRKIRSIVWIGVGLACMARYAVGRAPAPEVDGGDKAAHRQRG
jgi:hypothetical protein